jgi:hypothetical protein
MGYVLDLDAYIAEVFGTFAKGSLTAIRGTIWSGSALMRMRVSPGRETQRS